MNEETTVLNQDHKTVSKKKLVVSQFQETDFDNFEGLELESMPMPRPAKSTIYDFAVPLEPSTYDSNGEMDESSVYEEDTSSGLADLDLENPQITVAAKNGTITTALLMEDTSLKNPFTMSIDVSDQNSKSATLLWMNSTQPSNLVETTMEEEPTQVETPAGVDPDPFEFSEVVDITKKPIKSKPGRERKKGDVTVNHTIVKVPILILSSIAHNEGSSACKLPFENFLF
ncbi:unnamed protein product [Strongylus vulgaris]|uniref:Uncharacterized protein n=1 Tax=Strongylus vulgaris TaxID=40348 RepID=A0A3P7JVD9_STRVU|nr:unnamed protein product [Strongylus vulgaris]